MKSITKKAAITAAAVAAAVGIGMGPAAAAGAGITVTGGGAFTASAAPVTLTAGVSMSCPTADASGVITAGSYTTPAAIGTITSSGWHNCTALGFSSSVAQSGTWDIVATGAPVGGVTPGEIDNVDATVTIGGGICTLHVTGSAGGNFNNATQELTLTGTSTLTVAQSGFCPGVTSTGSFTGTYAVAAATPVAIS